MKPELFYLTQLKNGSFIAQNVDEPGILTEAETLEEIEEMAIDAYACFHDYDANCIPGFIVKSISEFNSKIE